jgi:hypothetical protein
MATKKQKREAGEAKAKREAEERRQAGLAAQKANRGQQDQRRRTTLLNRGVNPSTGLLFTDEEMEEMRKKANTSERKHLYDRIAAGRAGTLNEQPPLNMSDYSAEADASGFEMTVGDFRDKMDRLMPLFLVAPGETEAPIRKFLNEEGEF